MTPLTPSIINFIFTHEWMDNLVNWTINPNMLTKKVKNLMQLGGFTHFSFNQM